MTTENRDSRACTLVRDAKGSESSPFLMRAEMHLVCSHAPLASLDCQSICSHDRDELPGGFDSDRELIIPSRWLH